MTIEITTASEETLEGIREALGAMESSLSGVSASPARINLSAVGSVTTGVTGASAITNMMSLTQAQYNAISPAANTLYVIV